MKMNRPSSDIETVMRVISINRRNQNKRHDKKAIKKIQIICPIVAHQHQAHAALKRQPLKVILVNLNHL